MMNFQTTAFGLGPASRVFTKITKPILVHIRQNLNSLCYVFRRPPYFWEDQDRLPSKGKESNDTVTRIGFHNRYNEINLRAQSTDRVSGPNAGLNPDERVSRRTKGFIPNRIMSSNFINDISDSKVSSRSSMKNEFFSPCGFFLPQPFTGQFRQTSTKQQAKPTISAKN